MYYDKVALDRVKTGPVTNRDIDAAGPNASRGFLKEETCRNANYPRFPSYG